jgi:Tol biopolymer transport system component
MRTATGIVGLLAASLLAAAAMAGGPAPKAAPSTGSGQAAWLKDIPYRIVHETYRPSGASGSSDDNNWELFSIRADGSDPQNLTKTPDVNEMYPHVSPDGKMISFVVNAGKGEATRRSGWVMNMDGTGRRKIADDAREVFWVGDGKTLGILPQEFPTKYVDEDWASKGLLFYDLATGKTTPHPNKDLFHLYNTCSSADGEWLVSTIHGGLGFDHAIIAFAIGGTKAFNLNLGGCRPDFSPDMKHVCWGSDDFHLGIADLDFSGGKVTTKNARTLFSSAEPNKIYHIDWSPDGRYVAFSRGPQPNNLKPPCEMLGLVAKGWNICVGNVATGEWAEVTHDGLANKEPDWAP